MVDSYTVECFNRSTKVSDTTTNNFDHNTFPITGVKTSSAVAGKQHRTSLAFGALDLSVSGDQLPNRVWVQRRIVYYLTKPLT